MYLQRGGVKVLKKELDFAAGMTKKSARKRLKQYKALLLHSLPPNY
jgi:hypothetical protein